MNLTYFKFTTSDPESVRRETKVPTHMGYDDGMRVVSLCGIRFRLVHKDERPVTCKRCLKEINA